MTDSSENNYTSDTVEQAMNTVLQAERAAEQAIADCNSEAQLAIQAALGRAQHIAARTDERLAHCHMRCSAKVSRELKTRQRAENADSQVQSTLQLDNTALAEVVAVVARDLIGASRPEGEGRDTSE